MRHAQRHTENETNPSLDRNRHLTYVYGSVEAKGCKVILWAKGLLRSPVVCRH